MLQGYKQTKISEYRKLYDIIVSKENILRKIKDNIDFSFVNKLLEKNYCKYYGRPASEPEMMFKLLFLKVLYNLSDENVVKNAEVNMAYKYFLDLDPEDKLIDPSLLTKFRGTRINSEDILEEMLNETVKQAIDKGIIKSNTILVDATHSKSKSNVETPMQILKKASKQLRKEVYKTNAEISDSFAHKTEETTTIDEEIVYTKELIAVIEKQVHAKDTSILKEIEKVKALLQDDKIKEIQSSVDFDAKIGHKSHDTSFLGYKTHIAMSKERIITAIEVTSGEAADGKYLIPLIEKTNKAGLEVNEVLGDSAYSGSDNLEYMDGKNIMAVTPLNPVITNGNRKEDDGFEYIKDADMLRCPAGHLSKRKEKVKGKNNKNSSIKYIFDIEKCKQCKYKDGCYKDGAKKKTYSIRILSNIHKKSVAFEETEEFKIRKKERYKIEAKNSELKNAHGLDRCKFNGLFGMKKQSYFASFVVNVKRIVKIISSKHLDFYDILSILIEDFKNPPKNKKLTKYSINFS